MRNEIIQILACNNNYECFQHLTFIISQKNSFHYLKDYLMTKLTFSVNKVYTTRTKNTV